MYYGRAGLGIVFAMLHLIAAGAFLYFMYSIAKSLKKIANRPEKASAPTIEGTQAPDRVDRNP